MRVLSFFTGILLLAAPVFAGDFPATISVTGEGRVEAAPDMATISLGVQNDAATAVAALAENSEAVAAVLGRLKVAGIAERDIQTSGLSLGPQYDYGRGDGAPPTVVGYSASNMVTVRVRQLERLGLVLDAVVAEGANTLNGLTFGLADDQAIMDEARGRAVADAARKAGLYAEAAGVKLGAILSISEAGAAQPPIAMMRAEASFAKGGDVPMSPGELNLSASVSIVYAIAE